MPRNKRSGKDGFKVAPSVAEQFNGIVKNIPFSPYYHAGGIVLYNANCEEILPFIESVDLLMIDPPYGIGEAAGKNKSRGKAAVAKDYGDDTWDDKPSPQ